jgi:hypothetical protein
MLVIFLRDILDIPRDILDIPQTLALAAHAGAFFYVNPTHIHIETPPCVR